MTQAGYRVWAGLAATIFVVGLPFAGHRLRQGDAPRCTLDGLPIDPVYRVRVVDAAGESRAFCCIHCAAQCPDLKGTQTVAVYVTDEATGTEVEASRAYLVESPVVTNLVTGNRFHAFRDRADAESHIVTFGGVILGGADRPLPNAPDSRTDSTR